MNAWLCLWGIYAWGKFTSIWLSLSSILKAYWLIIVEEFVFHMSLKAFSEQIHIESLFYQKLWRYKNKTKCAAISLSISVLNFSCNFTFKALIQHFSSGVCLKWVLFINFWNKNVTLPPVHAGFINGCETTEHYLPISANSCFNDGARWKSYWIWSCISKVRECFAHWP